MMKTESIEFDELRTLVDSHRHRIDKVVASCEELVLPVEENRLKIAKNF